MNLYFAKYDKRLLQILFWEFIENAPILIFFLLAIRIQSENLTLTFIYLLTGSLLSIGLIHFTEVKKFSNQPTTKESLTNLVVFTTLTIPLIFYFGANNVWWSSWITDILFGIVAGSLLALGESWGWKDKTGIQGHIISMSISSALFLFCIRLIYKIESPIVMIIFSLLFNLGISLIIVFIDYWPIKEDKELLYHKD